jgi:hypothetical protein
MRLVLEHASWGAPLVRAAASPQCGEAGECNEPGEALVSPAIAPGVGKYLQIHHPPPAAASPHCVHRQDMVSTTATTWYPPGLRWMDALSGEDTDG